MPWLIIKFDLENAVEAAPRIWYREKTPLVTGH